MASEGRGWQGKVRSIRDPEATHGAILKAARAVLAERGPEALSVSEVAHRAGINRTTAYQHFRTREELIGAVLAEVSDDVSLLLTRDGPTGEGLHHMVQHFVDHPEISRLWMFQLLHEIPIAHDTGPRRYIEKLRSLADGPETQDGIDPEMLGAILTAAAHVWSLSVSGQAKNAAQVKAKTRRFIREFNRLVLYGVMRPEAWPEMVASLHPDSDQDAPDQK